MPFVKTSAVPVGAAVQSGIYAPRHVGLTDYTYCWEARTALPATTTRSLPGMVPGSPALGGASVDVPVQTNATGKVDLVKTANSQALFIAGTTAASRTIMLVSSYWGGASRHAQLPGMSIGSSLGQLQAYGTTGVNLMPDSGGMAVRVIAMDTVGGQVWAQVGSTVVAPKVFTASTTTGIYAGSNANATGGNEERIRAVRIWDRALTAAEIATVVSTAAAAYGV